MNCDNAVYEDFSVGWFDVLRDSERDGAGCPPTPKPN